MNFSTRSLRLVLLIGVALSLQLAFDGWPLLRGPREWQWALAAFPPTDRLALVVSALAAFVIGWWLLGRQLTPGASRSYTRLSLIALISLALLFQAALLGLVRTNPVAIQFERLASDQASGYFTVAQEIEHLPTFLHQFPELMPNFRPDPHPRSKPPGIILLYWGLEQPLTRLPAVAHSIGNWARGIRCADLWLATLPDSSLAANVLMGILTPIASALAIWVAYALVALWLGPQAGWLAAGLVALMPGRLMFTPQMDTVYPLLTLLALYLVETGWQKQRPFHTFGAGIILSVATFFSLVNALSAVIVGLYLLGRIWQSEHSIRPGLRSFFLHGTSLVAGTLSLWAIYWASSGVTPFDIYLAAAPARHDLARNYWVWLVGNLYDLALFAGLPAFLLAFLYLGQFRMGRARRQNGDLSLLLVFWPVLLVLDASGIIRGEVGRIWLMLAPLPALLAAAATAPFGSKPLFNKLPIPLAVIAVTALLSGIMAVRWEVTQLEWPAPENRPVVTAVPPHAEPVTAVFGANINLLGYEMGQDSSILNLTLYWQSQSRLDLPYTIFIHAIDPQGTLIAQQDGMPQNGHLPTTCWRPGEIVSDSHQLTLPEDESGPYTLLLGVYDARDGSRLAIDAPNNAFPLTEVDMNP
jgi:hypothetical protein